jgi:hypothetical protein
MLGHRSTRTAAGRDQGGQDVDRADHRAPARPQSASGRERRQAERHDHERRRGKKTFTAKPVDPSNGTYSARVVFPSVGTWNYAVFDDFTSADGEPVPCSRTHEIGTATIEKGAPGVSTSGTGGLPIWPLAGGALLLVAAGLYFRRQRGLRAGRTPVV